MSRSTSSDLSSHKGVAGFTRSLLRDLSRNRYVYFMAIPVIMFYILFHYIPMYGAMIAFKDFAPARGIVGSPWVGFKHFEQFFQSFYFGRVVTNTLAINVLGLIFGFPAPILLALLLNEVRSNWFKRTIQTVSYLPHFISIMVIAGLLIDFSSRDGLFNTLIVAFGGERSNLLTRPELFRTLYVGSDIWQGIGWGSIIYLAALSGIDPQLYEAARIDGAGRLRQTFHITIPGILPTIVILLVLRIGQMMNVGFEKIILLYNANTYETADVISSYVYRKGLLEFSYSFSAAVGLFNSLINFFLLIFANKMSRMLNETSLW